ncbi:hypothetical protein [Aliamphritea spongicola]|uniref:hypothetical protein n=1 Tax=Aliamphritea spongicola TaxID=707589 RepID=UPI00196ABAA8|nr:hypothetical protein [Aliamphritea spongicola]MBN3562706.1 hypothetical protein [Aliamphritea spongicola]
MMLICALVTLVAQTYSVSSVASMTDSPVGMETAHHVSTESMSDLAMLCQDMSAAEAMACCEDMSAGSLTQCCDCDASCASMQCASSVFTAGSAGLDMIRERQILPQLRQDLPAQALSSLYRPPIAH